MFKNTRIFQFPSFQVDNMNLSHQKDNVHHASLKWNSICYKSICFVHFKCQQFDSILSLVVLVFHCRNQRHPSCFTKTEWGYKCSVCIQATFISQTDNDCVRPSNSNKALWKSITDDSTAHLITIPLIPILKFYNCNLDKQIKSQTHCTGNWSILDLVWTWISKHHHVDQITN